MNEKAAIAQAMPERANSDSESVRPLDMQRRVRERSNYEVVVELAVERGELCRKIDALTRAIEADPKQVSECHKSLWRDQLEAMVSYKNILSKRIADLMGFAV